MKIIINIPPRTERGIKLYHDLKVRNAKGKTAKESMKEQFIANADANYRGWARHALAQLITENHTKGTLKNKEAEAKRRKEIKEAGAALTIVNEGETVTVEIVEE